MTTYVPCTKATCVPCTEEFFMKTPLAGMGTLGDMKYYLRNSNSSLQFCEKQAS